MTLKTPEEIRARLWWIVQTLENAPQVKRAHFGGSNKGRVSEREATRIGTSRLAKIECARGLLQFMGDPDPYGEIPTEFRS